MDRLKLDVQEADEEGDTLGGLNESIQVNLPRRISSDKPTGNESDQSPPLASQLPPVSSLITTDAGAHSKHHHHHHHSSAEPHAHSPPTADYPPIRANTLSGIADIAALASEPGRLGKKKFMFMSNLGKKFKDVRFIPFVPVWTGGL